MRFSRRDVLGATGRLAAGAIGTRLFGSAAFAQQDMKLQPEQGASLRVLRWSPFVKGDEDRGSPTPRSSRTRPASRSASTRRAGRTSVRRRRSRPMSARAPTSCGSGSTTRQHIPTSCST